MSVCPTLVAEVQFGSVQHLLRPNLELNTIPHPEPEPGPELTIVSVTKLQPPAKNLPLGCNHDRRLQLIKFLDTVTDTLT